MPSCYRRGPGATWLVALQIYGVEAVARWRFPPRSRDK
jgi:hypothetical protein